jgi:hypothetical protein
MAKKTDYLSFMGFYSAIFLGNSGLYAASQQPNGFQPFSMETSSCQCYVLREEINGKPRHFVEQKYRFGSIFWEKSPLSKVVVPRRAIRFPPPGMDLPEDKIRGVRYFTFGKDPEGLQKALKKCRDPDRFIDYHPDLLLQFMAKYGHSCKDDEDYWKVIDLLVKFGYCLEECSLYSKDEA